MSALALALLIASGACAGRNDAEIRAGWDRAVAGAGRGDAGAGDGGKGSGGGAVDDEVTSREALTAFVKAAAEAVARGFATVDIDALVETLCSDLPDVHEGERGTVYHCVPEPSLTIRGHALTLEIGESGVIGLVATGLDDEESRELLAEALGHAKSETWCTSATAAVPRAGDAHREFHTCAAPSGPLLAIGRFPSDLAADEWQFSLAVLAPG